MFTHEGRRLLLPPPSWGRGREGGRGSGRRNVLGGGRRPPPSPGWRGGGGGEGHSEARKSPSPDRAPRGRPLPALRGEVFGASRQLHATALPTRGEESLSER